MRALLFLLALAIGSAIVVEQQGQLQAEQVSTTLTWQSWYSPSFQVSSSTTAAQLLGQIQSPTSGYCSQTLSSTGALSNQGICHGNGGSIGELITIAWTQPCNSYGSFRIGFDWGYGGGMIVDGVLVHVVPSNYNYNWWSQNWGADENNGVFTFPERLFTAGHHTIQFVGFEPCCDGNQAINAMVRGGSWSAVDNSFSFACPPVDCIVDIWQPWGSCTRTCGIGTQTHTRAILTPASNGGAACPATIETQACNTQSCAATCSGYSCCAGYVLRTDAATATCQGACSVAQCCVPTCAAPTFTCNAPNHLKSNPSSIICDTKALSVSSSLGFTGYICLQSKCCESTGTCSSYGTCPAGYTPKAASTICSSSPCSQSDCCLAPTTTCFQTGNPVQQCTNGRVPAATYSCTDSGCNQDICCDETCGSADWPLLCANRPMNLGASTHRCSDQTGSGNHCLPDECCLTTCASDTNLKCGAGTTLRSNPDGFICSGSSCTTNECCVGSTPQCPADYPCNAGDVNKALPAYCATSPCLYTECCCSTCNYCGKHFTGTCPMGTKLQLNVDCGKDTVCTSDICCIASCFNYPCPDGPSDPSLINAQCANPKQCTQAECCQRWSD